MVDRISREHRSWNMSRIRSRDTKPEIVVRSLLHRMGFRFRLHSTDLPGKPDIVLPKYRTVIFVHGCFWHRHHCANGRSTPASRPDFWQAKFARTRQRDRSNRARLRRLGWSVMTIWECQITPRKQQSLIQRLETFLNANRRQPE